MIWRVVVIFDVLTAAAYVYTKWGETAAWAALAVMGAVILPLGMIERRLAGIAEGLPKARPCAKQSEKEQDA